MSINYPLLQKVCILGRTKYYKIACHKQFSLYPVCFDSLDKIHHYVFHYYNVYAKVEDVIRELYKQ